MLYLQPTAKSSFLIELRYVVNVENSPPTKLSRSPMSFTQEIIKVKGFQVAPAELEGCLLSHPDVADACVVGIADDYSGELPAAYVVLKAEAAQSIYRNVVVADYFSESISKVRYHHRYLKSFFLLMGHRKNSMSKIVKQVINI
jgi:acyl-coenzyme A synthetase/AMP-(fatty) acid ligase